MLTPEERGGVDSMMETGSGSEKQASSSSCTSSSVVRSVLLSFASARACPLGAAAAFRSSYKFEQETDCAPWLGDASALSLAAHAVPSCAVFGLKVVAGCDSW